MKHITQHLMNQTFACFLALAIIGTHAQAAESPAKQGAVTAIDILLEPDATMLNRSADNNARLLKVDPTGFSLDAPVFRPHRRSR
jgi:hypothetical protein